MIERVCGICSHSHSTAFVQAVEEIAGIQVPDRAKYMRTLIAELERIHSHLLWLGVAGHEIGFDKTAYELQTIKDNVRLFTPELLDRINHEVDWTPARYPQYYVVDYHYGYGDKLLHLLCLLLSALPR